MCTWTYVELKIMIDFRLLNFIITYAYMYTYTYIHIFARLPTCKYIYLHTIYMQTLEHAYILTFMHTCGPF